MIVKMKKIAIITQEKDSQETLSTLRDLGVVHIEHQQQPKGKNIQLLHDDLTLINQALEVISEEEFIEHYKDQDIKNITGDWRKVACHILDLWKRLNYLQEYSKFLAQQINNWQIWGDFNPEMIRHLEEKNIYVGFYQIPKKDYFKLPKDIIIEKVSEKLGMVYCVIISTEKLNLEFKQMELPKLGLLGMQKRLTDDKEIMAEINLELYKYLGYQKALMDIKISKEKELEFEEALSGMLQSITLSYLVGFVPAEKEEELLVLAKKEKWAILVTEPTQEDNVPTLISTPSWVSLIQPVFKFLEIVPGYRELDISPVFLIFLSLFFGMIIGDAGYGLVYILLTAFFQKKMSKKVPARVFFLFYLFSSCAVIWGLLTGTVFGQEWYLNLGMKPILPVLNNTKFLQAFCFFLGALHLTLAHSWRTLIKMPSIDALADVGWICLLWAGFFLANTLILDDVFPSFGKWLIIIGITLVIFFSNPQKNILKTIGSGLATIALGLMNNFTDVVSYIRLFAVGLAGVAVADTVNALTGLAGGNLFAKIMIVFSGHTVNLALGLMSVLVHGIRLNVLEFSSHANVSWSGMAYKPFKR